MWKLDSPMFYKGLYYLRIKHEIEAQDGKRIEKEQIRFNS